MEQNPAVANLAVRRVTAKRRSLTMLEEKCLCQAFQEIIALGWKTENGFRNGFLLQLEQKMKILIPGTDLKGEPMINSKYGTWKRHFKDVQDCLKNSGFNWCSGTKTVVAYPEVWDDLIAAHPHLGHVREKPWPFYETWVEIYGRDVANGNRARDYAQGPPPPPQAPPPVPTNNPNQMPPPPQAARSPPVVANQQPNFTYEEADDSYNGTQGPLHSDEQTQQSESATDASPKANGSESRKRKRIDAAEELAEVMKEMWGKAAAAIFQMTNRMGHEIDEKRKRKELFEKVKLLPIALTPDEQLKAALAIANHQKSMDVFFGLPVEFQCDLVRLALAGLLM